MKNNNNNNEIATIPSEDSSNENFIDIVAPKTIASITLCGAMKLTITDVMNWDPPTEEQIKNLKKTFNIDVKIYNEGDE